MRYGVAIKFSNFVSKYATHIEFPDGINIVSCIENGFLGIDTTRFLWQKLPLQFDLHKINMYASLSRFMGICLPVSVLCNRNFPIT